MKNNHPEYFSVQVFITFDANSGVNIQTFSSASRYPGSCVFGRKSEGDSVERQPMLPNRADAIEAAQKIGLQWQKEALAIGVKKDAFNVRIAAEWNVHS